jgi:LacI family transcriptional regulator
MPTVDSDNLRGAALAIEHLLALGHRRIAMVTGRPDLESSALRERGYREALAAAGVAIDEDLLQAGDYQAAASTRAARRLLEAPDPPTAIFAANDTSAIATIVVAQELGLRVPEDLSVIGFDHLPESMLCTPPLTTVEQRIHEMGARAMEMLVRLIRGEPLDRTHVTLDTRLVVRQTTAGPPA